MNKRERQLIFDKTGGKCAYCGEVLGKSWHADHIVPIRRDYEWTKGHWRHVGTGQALPMSESNKMSEDELIDYRWYASKLVPNGCIHPSRDHAGNCLPSCASCNINKHAMSIDEFRKAIYQYVESLNKRFVQYKIAKKYGLIAETPKPIVFYFETLGIEIAESQEQIELFDNPPPP